MSAEKEGWLLAVVDGSDALAQFHRGERKAIEACYREHYAVVHRAALAILNEADAETIVHEVFLRILTRAEVRLAFRGGSMAAWISTIAKNLAIDYHRKRRREQPVELAPEPVSRIEEATEARLLIAEFRRNHLPEEWVGVFEARFLEQKSQRDAAESLGIRRTTLAYRELRIRALLKRFLLQSAREVDR